MLNLPLSGCGAVLARLNHLDEEDDKEEEEEDLSALVKQLREENQLLKRQVEMMIESQAALMASLDEIKQDIKTLMQNM